MLTDWSLIERRSPWARLGPPILAFAIVGLGVGGAVRIVRAQDNVPQPPGATVAVVQAPDAPKSPVILEQDGNDNKLSDSERKRLHEELNGLLKQRGSLDERISKLQDRLGERRAFAWSFGPQGQMNGWGQKLTPEQQAKLNAELKKAQEQLQKALKNMPSDGSFNFVMPPIAALPDMPRMPMNFRWEGKSADGKAWANDAQMQEFQKKMQVWEQEFQKRMEKWQREFESRMRRQFPDKAGKGAPPAEEEEDSTGSTEEPKESGPDVKPIVNTTSHREAF